MSTELVEVTKAVAEFDRVEAGLAALRDQYANIVFDVTTSKGMTEAKAARAAIREPRYEIERIRKWAKAPILALGKKLDSEASRITKELEALECPIADAITDEEMRKERERQAKIDAEQQRVAGLQERVAELRGNRTLSVLSGSALIADHVSDVERIAVDDSFQEFREAAEAAKIVGLQWLRELHAAALAQEAEQERIKAERAELARLRAEQREAERVREVEAARQVEASRAAREAEEALQRAERERLATEQRRLNEERAEFERAQAEERRQREEEDRRKREKARLASIKRPSDDEIVGVLAKHYNVPASKVLVWLAASKWKKADAA